MSKRGHRMTQEICQFCRRNGATTLEIPAMYVICILETPIFYVCEAHLASAKKEFVERYGTALACRVVLLSDDTERKFQFVLQGLPAKERPLASARISLRMIRKAGSNTGICRGCGTHTRVTKKEWDRVSNPRCSVCGGMLDRAEPAMTKKELLRHESAVRRNRS